MNVKDACLTLARVEQNNDINSIEMDGFQLWPLIRHCLWFELVDSNGKSEILRNHRRDAARKVLRTGRHLLEDISARISRKRFPGEIPTRTKTLFLSRPVYLQRLLASESWFDRIIDPLVFLSCEHEETAKCYVSDGSFQTPLYYNASQIRPKRQLICTSGLTKIQSQLDAFSRQSGLAAERVRRKFSLVWRNFLGWYHAGKLLLSDCHDLKRIFLTSWYFPDMMGIIAAAREFGIETIDVQHGKQGQFQGMYTWWTRIPSEGYHLKPDLFWCWGQPTCNHILSSSAERKTHTPFIGGFPWLEYYRRYISKSSGEDPVRSHDRGENPRVLVTLQAPQGNHNEPVPDFVIDFLLGENNPKAHFTFRCPPGTNVSRLYTYCQSRLGRVPANRFVISNGVANLYDEMLMSTHHITAYSSCCYEAEAFGLPTLLFGEDSKEIYKDEISSHIFHWTEGSVTELAAWLKTPPRRRLRRGTPYIESSLELAARALSR